MQIKISPSFVNGSVVAPPSKSAMQRACALALLNRDVTMIANPGKSNDDKAALDIIRSLGAKVDIIGEELKVQGTDLFNDKTLPQHELSNTINCGESGLSIRMFTPIAALSSSPISVTGSGSLLTRPMNFFDEILPKLGVQISSNNGKLPLQIQGPIVPADITVDGSLSSQFLTGLLIAFAKAAQKPVTITVTDLKSKPYIDLTLAMMQHFGYEVKHDDYKQFYIEPSTNRSQTQVHYQVEGDWSGAAFLLVAAAIAGNVKVSGLDVFSAQADRSILQALSMSKALLSITEQQIEVKTSVLQPFQFDATDCPDLFPPLVSLAAYCKGTSIITGVSRLAHKESDRAITLQQEFGKMGLAIKLQDDLMIIEGGNGLTGTTVTSHHDHRIAMALAVAALKANGETIIENPEAIDKSYPDFYQHLSALGASVIS
jgi:3-phosphoshikimate 1-carboxyvinyltransferase